MNVDKTLTLIYVIAGCIGVTLVLATQKFEDNQVAKFLNYLGCCLASIGGFGLLIS